MKGWEKLLQANGNQKKAGPPILRQSRLKAEMVKRDKEGHCIVMKGSVHQEGITIKIFIHQTLEYLNI